MEVGPADLEDEDDFDGIGCVRAKWSMDGAASLSEAAAMLRRYAEWLEELERDGWQLIEPVDDDYGHISNPDPQKRL